MSPQDHKRVKHLLDLAEASADFATVNLALVNYFTNMREDLGLAKLLLLIQEYANRPETETPQVTESNQNPASMQ